MHQILTLLFLFSGIHATAQEQQVSPRARELTQALAVLRASPDNSPAQERYLKTFPHDYAAFLNLFDMGRELSDGYDFIHALSLTEKDHAAELGALLVGLAKDAHYEADAPSYLQHLTAAYAGQHPSTFADLSKQLPPQKQTQLITFLADVEVHSSNREYQAIIDGLRRAGENELAIRFEKARTKRERQPHDPKSR